MLLGLFGSIYNEGREMKTILMCSLIAWLIGFFIGEWSGERDGYENGQIDAIKGKIKYVLKKDEKWVKKEPNWKD